MLASRYLTSFFLFPVDAITGSTAMFLARLVCATIVQGFWRTTTDPALGRIARVLIPTRDSKTDQKFCYFGSLTGLNVAVSIFSGSP